MGNTKNSAGKRVFTDVAAFLQDLQDLGDDLFAAAIVLNGTADARGTLPAGYLRDGMTWVQTDGTRDTYQWFTATGWIPLQQATVARYARPTGSDAAVGTGAYIGLIEGTITDAKAGRYLVVARASLYAQASNVIGRVYAETQSAANAAVREEARWDIPNVGSYPTSPTVQVMINHTGGNLRIACGYRRDSGTFVVTGVGSGETVVTATYLGPA